MPGILSRLPSADLGKSHRRGYGRANLDHDLPISTSTTFDIGSIAKQFTAVAVLLLAEEGKLSLDDPVRKYLPELPDYGSPLTLRHLLHHTSGIRDYLAIGTLVGLDPHQPFRLDDVVSLIVRQQGLEFRRDDRGKITGFELDAGRVNNIHFRRLAEGATAEVRRGIVGAGSR